VTSKSTPTISWSTPAPVTVGTALSSTQLNATANVPGSFAYTPAPGTIMSAAGTQELKAVFTPADAINYNSATASVFLTVNDAPILQAPSITSSAFTTAYKEGYYFYAVKASDPNGDVLSYSLTTKPSGMTINAATGLIYWRPGSTGSYSVTVRVTDPSGLYATQSYKVSVVSKPDSNSSPRINSSPVTTATAGVAYSYDVNATDSNGDTVYYRLYTAQTGMTIDLATGMISWTPTSAQTGSKSVTVEALDSKGGRATQSFTIKVAATVGTNNPPAITNPGNQSHVKGALVSLQIQASDPDGDSVNFSATGLPAGLSISSNGLISGIISSSALSTNNVVVTVTDGTLSSSISFTWAVTGTTLNKPPVISSTPVTSVYKGRLYTYSVKASDPDGDTLTYSLTTKPSGMTINSTSGQISWTPSSTGTYSVKVRVTDSNGAYTTQGSY
jgi:large repetitive protein